ncbi:hypothetical protein [Reichenbachiella sp.]|uniref:hypothetical protein n=1 Tax=Reichenbachiella sp. TaxID=2184521 RepID=UPI003B5BB4B3
MENKVGGENRESQSLNSDLERMDKKFRKGGKPKNKNRRNKKRGGKNKFNKKKPD